VVNARLHAVSSSRLAPETAVAASRLVCAAVVARTALATELAALIHMLMKGFFFSQGFLMVPFHGAQTSLRIHHAGMLRCNISGGRQAPCRKGRHAQSVMR